MSRAALLPKVRSIGELKLLARSNRSYRSLAIVASKNLGGPDGDDLERHLTWLDTNAMETDEDGVVKEVNFCRDLVRAKPEAS